MLSFMKWLVAVAVLAVVVCAACDGRCCGIVPLAIMEGLCAGMGHGFVAAHCLIDHTRNPGTITARRLLRLIHRDARVGLVTGLLTGVTYALIALLS